MMGGRRSLAFGAVTLLLTVAALLWILRDVSGQELAQSLREANALWLLGGFGLMLLYVALEGVCMYLSLRTMRQPISLRSSIRYAFVGFYFSGITPSASGGQPAQVYCMNRDGVNGSCAALSLLLISGVYQISMLFYGAVMVFAQRQFLKPAVESIRFLLTIGASWNVLLIAAIMCFLFSPEAARRAASGLLHLWERLCGCIRRRKESRKTGEAASRRLERMLADYRQGSEYLKHHSATTGALLLISLVRLTMLYSIPWFVAMAFGASQTTAGQMIALSAILSLAVSSLPLPGAAGASESVSFLLFSMVFSSALLGPAVLLIRSLNFYGVLCISAATAALQCFQTGAHSRRVQV